MNDKYIISTKPLSGDDLNSYLSGLTENQAKNKGYVIEVYNAE